MMTPNLSSRGVQELLTIDQVAAALGLHVKTVRGYVREGRLKAVRIGKAYRISKADLEALTGPIPAPVAETARRERHVDVSCIVEIDVVSPDEATRITTGLTGAANGRRADGPRLRIGSFYDEERARLKVILTGPVATCGALLQLLSHYVDDGE